MTSSRLLECGVRSDLIPACNAGMLDAMLTRQRQGAPLEFHPGARLACKQTGYGWSSGDVWYSRERWRQAYAVAGPIYHPGCTHSHGMGELRAKVKLRAQRYPERARVSPITNTTDPRWENGRVKRTVIVGLAHSLTIPRNTFTPTHTHMDAWLKKKPGNAAVLAKSPSKGKSTAGGEGATPAGTHDESGVVNKSKGTSDGGAGGSLESMPKISVKSTAAPIGT